MSKGFLRKIVPVLALMVILPFILTGCSGSNDTAKQQSQAPGTAVKTKGLTDPLLDQPALVTSIGQSADGQIVKTLIDRNGIKYQYDALAKPEMLDTNKTLVVVLGVSMKGMGAAGVNVGQEEARLKAFLQKAKETNKKVLVMHVGGAQRRGETDRLIKIAMPAADYAIVVAEGDKDQIFANIATDKIPVDYPNTAADAGGLLKKAFK